MRKLLLALGSAALMVAVSAAPAAAAARAPAAVPTPVSVVITSVSPDIGKPHANVTVTGYITNTTADPLTGLTLQLWSSGSPFANRQAIAAYLGAAAATGDQPVPDELTAVSSLPAHATQRWSLTLKPASVGISSFGVYPVAVQASQGGVPLFGGRARTLLPYQPATAPHSAQQKLKIAWVWPLIDTPQQTACRALLTDKLAGSIAPAGRLGRLLAAGAGPAGQRAQLTWAIDPSLLTGVVTMTSQYRVGASPACSGGVTRQASGAARGWLHQLRAATSRADFFVTPYADVDVAALSHHGLDGDLRGAFSSGRSAAAGILGQSQHPAAPVAAGSGSTAALGASTVAGPRKGRSGRPLGAIAWPADGLADYGVLGSLAVNRVGTVILDGAMMPPAAPPAYTASGVATTTTGIGTALNVLLTDDGLDRILATAPTSAAPGGQVAGSPAPVAAQAAAFTTEQQFLAETAMIVGEAPNVQRSVIIAPPRRWDPAGGVAQQLLQETAAPWLQPVSLASLATGKPGPGAVQRRQPPQSQVSGRELRPSLMHKLKELRTQIDLQASILSPRPPDYLGAAVASVESSAWRDSRAGQRSAKALLGRLEAYLTAQRNGLGIVDPPRVTLGGRSGSVPVSIFNHLSHNVKVQLKISPVTPGRIVIGKFSHEVLVRAGQQPVFKIPVQSAEAGSTTLSIRLAAPDGTLLPGESATLTVQATHFGNLALVIIGIAFGVFVLGSIGRAVRRGGGPEEDGPDDGEEPGELGISTPNPPGEAAGPDTVGAQWAQPDHTREEFDEHASTRGRADPS